MDSKVVSAFIRKIVWPWLPELARPEIWCVWADPERLPAVLEDAAHALMSSGVPWVEALCDPGRALAAFRTRDPVN